MNDNDWNDVAGGDAGNTLATQEEHLWLCNARSKPGENWASEVGYSAAQYLAESVENADVPECSEEGVLSGNGNQRTLDKVQDWLVEIQGDPVLMTYFADGVVDYVLVLLDTAADGMPVRSSKAVVRKVKSELGRFLDQFGYSAWADKVGYCLAENVCKMARYRTVSPRDAQISGEIARILCQGYNRVGGDYSLASAFARGFIKRIYLG